MNSQIHESINRTAFSRHLNPMRAVEAHWAGIETLAPKPVKRIPQLGDIVHEINEQYPIWGEVVALISMPYDLVAVTVRYGDEEYSQDYDLPITDVEVI